MFTLICARINGWVNNCEAGDLRRNCAHYDVIVMKSNDITCSSQYHLSIIKYVTVISWACTDTAQLYFKCTTVMSLLNIPWNLCIFAPYILPMSGHTVICFTINYIGSPNKISSSLPHSRWHKNGIHIQPPFLTTCFCQKGPPYLRYVGIPHEFWILLVWFDMSRNKTKCWTYLIRWSLYLNIPKYLN